MINSFLLVVFSVCLMSIDGSSLEKRQSDETGTGSSPFDNLASLLDISQTPDSLFCRYQMFQHQLLCTGILATPLATQCSNILEQCSPDSDSVEDDAAVEDKSEVTDKCPPLEAIFHQEKTANIHEDSQPSRSSAWENDCNVDSSGNHVLVGLFDTEGSADSSGKPLDIDYMRCADYQTSDLVLSNPSRVSADYSSGSSGTISCPSNSVITALFDQSVKYQSLQSVKCLKVGGEFSVDAKDCQEVSVAPGYRQAIGELPKSWVAQCPSDAAYGITELQWKTVSEGQDRAASKESETDKELSTMKCCRLVRECESTK